MSKAELIEKKEKSYAKKLQSHTWKLLSIYETGLVPDMARYNDVDVEIIFGKLNIYAVYGNKSEVFPYKFISPKIFKVSIGGNEAICRIHKLTDKKLVFHADFQDSHFIVEMEKRR